MPHVGGGGFVGDGGFPVGDGWDEKTIELAPLDPSHPNLLFLVGPIHWIARIIWASQ